MSNYFGTGLDQAPLNEQLGEAAYWDLQELRYALDGKLRTISTNGAIIKPYESVEIDTSAGEVTALLPANPMLNTRVFVSDAKSTWDENKGMLDGNGSAINGSNDVLDLNIRGFSFTAIFIGGATGWRLRMGGM